MADQKLETAIVADLSRHMPLSMIGDMARGIQASGVVDYIHISDQLMSWFPRDMWTPDQTPMAKVVPDIDSFPDPFMMGATVAAAAPELGVSLTTDSVRRGAPEVAQSLLTLANLSKRAPIMQMGAGEIKQCRPFGHKRAEGLGRLEDQMRVFNQFWDSTAPFDFKGNHLQFDQAWIGSHRGANKPRFWGLGGGPKFFDYATSYADGVGTAVRYVWSTPEQAYAGIKALKEKLEQKGRDPDAFTFGAWCVAAIHEDEDVLAAALKNPLVRWLAAVFGRLNMSDWVDEGLQPPFPVDWHYAMKLLPMQWSRAQAYELIDAMPAEIVDRSLIKGSPKQVAAEIQGYVDAGVNWVMVYDQLPIYLQPEEAQQALARSIEVCRLLKT